MNDALALPLYREVFARLAHKHALFMNEPAGDPVTALHGELLSYYRRPDGLVRHTVWFALQNKLCTALQQQHNSLRRLDRRTRQLCQSDAWTTEEMALFGELPLHYWDGCPTWQISWPSLQSLSAAHLDNSLRCSHLADADLPATIWIEWENTAAQSNRQPWIAQARGLLISRFAAFDAPADERRGLVQQVRTKHRPAQADGAHLLAALAELDDTTTNPCGYLTVVVLRSQSGLRFVPLLLGHERTAPLHDMLVLYKESSDRDRRKTRETEQVWANTAVRLMVYAAARQLFAHTARVPPSAVPPNQLGPALQFTIERNTIIMHKLDRRTWPPFCVES